MNTYEFVVLCVTLAGVALLLWHGMDGGRPSGSGV